MPRIAGVNIPENKRIVIALTYIYGVGLALSKKILAEAKIDPSRRASQLTPDEINKLREVIGKECSIEGDLRRIIMMNIRRLKEISCWRGLRHIKGLPARGQKTKTNTRTVRGNVRKTVGSGRKLPPSPK
ncbi:30S ribosomal protein S13 [Patescibacteria group bacterium]|nr:30S ribosomal protein S13 [Patescibacteria group bacterium]